MYFQEKLTNNFYDLLTNYWRPIKPKQKLVCVGTKAAGNYALYKINSNELDESGTFMVTDFKYLNFTSSEGSKYWGEFSTANLMNGTLLIPKDDINNTKAKTGTWTGRKL